MKVTLLLALLSIAALCLLLYAAVAFIQDRRLFTSAPKDIQAVALDHEERFSGQHIIGWILAIIALAMFVFVIFYAGYDGIRNGFSFWDFFVRYLLILYILKAFDIICLDYYLLTRSHFFQRYYPETEGCEGYHSFGFNRREQTIRIIIFPFLSLLAAWICTLFM